MNLSLVKPYAPLWHRYMRPTYLPEFEQRPNFSTYYDHYSLTEPLTWLQTLSLVQKEEYIICRQGCGQIVSYKVGGHSRLASPEGKLPVPMCDHTLKPYNPNMLSGVMMSLFCSTFLLETEKPVKSPLNLLCAQNTLCRLASLQCLH